MREDEEDVLTAAEGLLHMSAMASSCEDALRNTSTQTNYVFPMLDLKYLRLRLGLLVTDAAARFAISPATMSKILTTWIKVMLQAIKVIFP